jgi:formylglycine-generating enzyme required for sulfatase activity
MVLAACREILEVIARKELPDVPGREEEIQFLVGRAMSRVPAVLATLSETSEGELVAVLRRALLDQLSPLSSRPATDLASQDRGHASTRRPGSGDTPKHSDAAEFPAPADALTPTTDHPKRRESLPDAELAGVQTVPESVSAASDGRAGRSAPGLTQLEGFEHISEIDTGGMGVVYRAWQTRLKRSVALKCLRPEFAQDPERLRRFQQEVLLSAGLTEPGILHVYGVLEKGGAPILVLPYIDGCDLNKIISQRRQLRDGKGVSDPHSDALKSQRDFVSRMLPLFDRILDALVGLHGADILHRDLKPSNILVDKNGNGWLTDFGLARLDRPDSATHKRQVLGTRGFMSPEQWEGDGDVDVRTDVFAMGVTLYEALALDLPYGKARITTATPPARLSKPQRRFLPSNLDLILLKAIHPNRELRYQTAADLRDDWQRVRKGQLPRKVHVRLKRRMRHFAWSKATLVIVGVAVALAVLAATKPPPASVPPPEPVRLRTVHVMTQPPGARVALVPLNSDDGAPEFDKTLQPDGQTPMEVSAVEPGDYLVVVEIPSHGFHEVYRRVPEPGEDSLLTEPGEWGNTPGQIPGYDKATESLAKVDYPHKRFTEHDGIVDLPVISVPKSDVTDGMALFPRGEFTMGSKDFGLGIAPPHLRKVEAFYLDKTEVTVAAYRSVRKAIPELLRAHSPKDEDAVSFVTFDAAVRCAEQMGKRLPDEAEYEFAATNAGKSRFPWEGDFDVRTPWTFGPVGSQVYDRLSANSAVCGLYSNVAEWTNSWNAPYPSVERHHQWLLMFRNQRVVRGGPYSVVEGKPRPLKRDEWQFRNASYRHGIDRDKAYPGLGFRCARSFKPRFPVPSGKTKI